MYQLKLWKPIKVSFNLESADLGVYNEDGDASNCNSLYSADRNTQIVGENPFGLNAKRL